MYSVNMKNDCTVDNIGKQVYWNQYGMALGCVTQSKYWNEAYKRYQHSSLIHEQLAPYDEAFMNGILNLTSNQVTCPDELALAQVICSLSVAESKLEQVLDSSIYHS